MTRQYRIGSIALLLVLSGLLTVSGPSRSATQAPKPPRAGCDPDLSVDDAALALRDKGKSQSAIAKLRPIVAKHPSNFRAVYILATALLQNSSKANQGEGMSTLLRALDLLPGQSQPCIVSFGWYSIYDTLGAQYHRRGDDANALRYFNLAAAHFDDQTAWTKSDLLGNLGQYYFTQGDLTKSLDYYQRAEKAGNHQAASRIAAIQAVNSTRYRAD